MFSLRTDLEKLACVARVSVRFYEQRTRNESQRPRENGVSKRARREWARKEGNVPSPPPPPTFIFWLLFHFSRGQNRESCSSIFLCSET